MPALLPGIDFLPVRVHRSKRLMDLPVNREPFLFFPAAYRAYPTAQVRRDFLPGFETLAGRGLGGGRGSALCAHRLPAEALRSLLQRRAKWARDGSWWPELIKGGHGGRGQLCGLVESERGS